MMVVALEFDDPKKLEAAIQRLRQNLGVTGELGIKPLEGGRWRLTISSEKPLRESSLEKLGGQRVDL